MHRSKNVCRFCKAVRDSDEDQRERAGNHSANDKSQTKRASHININKSHSHSGSGSPEGSPRSDSDPSKSVEKGAPKLKQQSSIVRVTRVERTQSSANIIKKRSMARRHTSMSRKAIEEDAEANQEKEEEMKAVRKRSARMSYLDMDMSEEIEAERRSSMRLSFIKNAFEGGEVLNNDDDHFHDHDHDHDHSHDLEPTEEDNANEHDTRQTLRKNASAVNKRKEMSRRIAVSADATEYKVKVAGKEKAMLAGIEDSSITLSESSGITSQNDSGSHAQDGDGLSSDRSPAGDGETEKQKNATTPPPTTTACERQEGTLNSAQISAVTVAFRRNNLFNSLDDDVIEKLSMNVIPLVVKKGTVVVKQGENGNFFFIVYKGSFRCEMVDQSASSKASSADGVKASPRVVATIGPHASFGELSLMYNCPRKATVIAIEDSEIFALERAMFTKTVVEMANAKTRERAQFLQHVPLLQKLTDSELAKLSSCLEEQVFKENTKVCSQGDEGDCMYLIFDGNCKVMKKVDGVVGEKAVATLSKGDYFGEQALLKDDVRSATVVVSSQSATLYKLVREDFEVLLGPLMSIVNDESTSRSKHYRMVRELPVMSSLSDIEVNQLLQVMVSMSFNKDELIELEFGSTQRSNVADEGPLVEYKVDEKIKYAFSIVVDGIVDVIDRVDVVRRLFRGDYFGSELTLLPQKALMLRANTTVHCICLKMDDYSELMGPLKKANKKRLEELERLKTILQSFKIVSQLDEDEFSLLSDMAEEKQFSAGEPIVEKFQPNDSAYIIMEGYVEIMDIKGVTFFKQPGEYFGQDALVTGSKEVISEYTATASQTTDCIVISQQMLRAVMSRRGDADLTGSGVADGGMESNNLFAIRVMKAVPLLSKYSFRELAKLATMVTMKEYKDREVILEEGSMGHSFYIIKSGKTNVMRRLGAMDVSESEKPYCMDTNKTLAPQLIAKLEAGDFFGEISLLTSKPATATVVANGIVEVLVMSRDDFNHAGGKLMEEVAQTSKQRLKHDKNSFAMHNYNIVQVIGRGAIGTVRLVQHADTKRYYALKSMRKDRIKAYRQEEHIINEKRIMSMLDHPFTVNILSYSATKSHLYLLIEFVQGGDFFTLLRQNGCLPEKIVMFYSSCIVSAFNYLHSRGIVYRDLKPENLLLDGMGYLRLTDYGLAKV